ncbi:hypothetical protein RvY_10117 [Ramazzottius varieornatus]|uniref:FAD-binding PCMH-type domain-containing protein n=1 Tax=Ramazzottius varieornatus TaxID=947166 RepID=A0A1D1VBP9_RAMVA|nr:hypothetical protein RvY_10117 [Ramazzottius varieornatus]
MSPPVNGETTQDGGVSVTINGNDFRVPDSFAATTLATFLRVHLGLTGTKVMCREGGCGVCTVHAEFPDPSGSGKIFKRSINSCLTPILSCNGWKIITVEGLGNQAAPHPIQKAMADYYGTQCGYCTPGWVMNMYSTLNSDSDVKLTKKRIEDATDGNICRCTGFRPILDAFKSFAKDDACKDGLGVDLEDLPDKMCHKTPGKKCSGKCDHKTVVRMRRLPAEVQDDVPAYHKPSSLDELYKLASSLKDQNVYYLVGHTGIGVYDDGPYDALVDMKGIKDLFGQKKSGNSLYIGAGVSYTDFIHTFRKEAASAGFEYLEQIADMVNKTAHESVRNVGSCGGNLVMKNLHQEFPSDLFTCLVAVDARIHIGPDNKAFSPEEFLAVDLKGKIVLAMELKAMDGKQFFRTYKVMPRVQNSHAYVNGAFRVKFDAAQKGKRVLQDKPAISLGNIHAKFIRAKQTEVFLTGKDLADVSVLQEALSIMYDEIQPEAKLDEADPEYKKTLAVNLFYKFALEVVGDLADSRFQSAIGLLPDKRPISSGQQDFPTQEENWPLTKPIPKIESLIQSTGEATYVSDIDHEGVLHAAFALSTEGNATIFKIDKAPALAIPGVLAVFTAEDIPGTNSYAPRRQEREELLAEKKVEFHYQPVALVVAVTKEAAEEGAKHVKVEYMDIQPVITTARQAFKKKLFFEDKPEEVVDGGDADKAIEKAARKVSGELELSAQFHFHMETQCSVAYPTEQGIDLDAGTQWPDGIQDCVSQVCGIDKNGVNVTVKRLGGGFGAKISRNNIISSAVALAALLVKRPVKMHMSLWDNMKSIGKRSPYYVTYEAGFEESGKLLGVKMDLYGAHGAQKNDSPYREIKGWLDNAYKSPAWKINLWKCKTNTPPNTHCRAPGSTEATYIMESIMEHVALSLNKVPIEVKQLNFYKDGDKALNGSKQISLRVTEVTEQLLKEAQFEERKKVVEEFNSKHRWRKRGLAVVPLRYPAQWSLGFNYSCLVAVYHNGGTIAVTHGGIEMGQGINTKVAQVVAYEMGVDLSMVKVHATQAIASANSFTTGGSITSEIACWAAIDCCKELKKRIEPVKKHDKLRALGREPEWKEVIEECYDKGIDLSARAWIAPKTKEPSAYYTNGCTCTEVELDTLTGEYQVNRLDVLYDCGESMSPFVDIGQVEGAIVMGLGYWLTEEIKYDEENGANGYYSTWKYKPPMAKDIPIDFRVKLLHNAPNPVGVMRSKLVAEPPLNMTCSVVYALRDAINAARIEQSGKDAKRVFQLVTPVTPERAQMFCGTDIRQLRYQA